MSTTRVPEPGPPKPAAPTAGSSPMCTTFRPLSAARSQVWDAVLRGVMDARGELGADPSEETTVTADTVMTYLAPLVPADDTHQPRDTP